MIKENLYFGISKPAFHKILMKREKISNFQKFSPLLKQEFFVQKF
jgi:hypothetical protein